MKNLILVISLFCSLNLFAKTVLCQAKLGATEIWEEKIELNSEKIKVGEVEHFQIFLDSNSKEEILEIYDPMTPSRQYAQGDIGKGLTWALWTRDILVEVKCSLVN